MNDMPVYEKNSSQTGARVQLPQTKLRKITWKLVIGIGRLFTLSLAIVLCLPVILLPLTTAVPAWAWILLGLLDVTLLVLQFRLQPTQLRIPISLGGILLVTILAIVASQAFAATPLIKDAAGKPLAGSIAVLEKVKINGTEQWITIRGQDVNKPILLNLGMGGPGGGGFATRSLFEPLEKDFVVVSWDEPGTGKSYRSVPISTLTPQRFVEDGHALTQYLLERFQREKIYVYGTSWSSIPGVWLIQKYPEQYYAFVGNGQMVNTTENDIQGYELALDYLSKKGDTKMLDILKRNGPPPYTGAKVANKYVAYLDILNDYMGSLHYTFAVPIVPFMAPEYGYVDKINHTLGLIASFNVIYPQLKNLDFIKQANKLDVPVYLFAGRNDVNAMSSIVERYFNILDAPHKDLIWLEGGHGLGDENLAQFVDVMVNKVLVETYPSH